MPTAPAAPAVALLLPEEVDRAVRWPEGRAERLARRGSLPHVRLPNGDIRFRQSDLNTIVAPATDRLLSPAPPALANSHR